MTAAAIAASATTVESLATCHVTARTAPETAGEVVRPVAAAIVTTAASLVTSQGTVRRAVMTAGVAVVVAAVAVEVEVVVVDLALDATGWFILLLHCLSSLTLWLMDYLESGNIGGLSQQMLSLQPKLHFGNGKVLLQKPESLPVAL